MGFPMSTATQPIPAFLINLARCPDRLERVSKHLQLRGVAFERVEACDGLVAGDEVLDQVTSSQGPLGGIARGHRACTVSHAWAWQRFLDASATHALFLEDDIFVASDTGGLLQNTGWVPPGADLIKLEKYKRGFSRLLLGPSLWQTPAGRQLHPLRSRHGGTGAYILSRKGAERVLAERGRISVQVDHFLFNATLSKLPRDLRPVIVTPGMATQFAVPYSSDTWTTGRTSRPPRWKRNIRSLRRGASEIRLIPLQTMEVLFCGARLRKVKFREDPPARPLGDP